MKAERVRIVWSGMGGELDSVVVTFNHDRGSEDKLTRALIKMLQGNIITPGDTIEVRTVED